MRWVVRLLAVLIGLAILGLGAVMLIPSDRVARLAIERFNAVTGRELTIEGAVTPSLWPTLGVSTGRVTLSNAPWSDEGPMLTADALSIRLDLSALLGGTLRITGIEVTRPEILLERSEDGQANWVFGGANGGTATADMAGAEQSFTLDLATIRDGSLGYIDHASGRALQLTAVDADLRLPAYDGTLDLSLTAESGEQPVSVAAQLGTFSTAYGGGIAPLSLTATAGAAKISFDGRAGSNPPAAQGALKADLADLSAISALLGIDRPALPQGFGAESVTLSGDITLPDPANLYLRNGTIGLDDTRLTGDLDLSLDGPRPRLTGKLAGGALGLAASPGTPGGGGGDQGAGGWSEAPIAADGLQALDADLSLSLGGLSLGAITLGPAKTHLTLDNGRAVLDLGRIAAYDGTLAGQIVVNARKGLSLGARLDLAGVALQPLLTDAAGYDRLIGSGDLTLDAVASGGSVAALMRSIDGQGSLTLGPGEIRGLDIPAMLATLNASQVGPSEKTVFDSLSASFNIENGDLFNDDLALASPYVRAKGNGRLGLGARDFDYRLRATALQGQDGADRLNLPIWITGPWADPKITLDLEALAQENLADQAAAAEDELRRRAAQELDQQEGESLEDAARRKAQEALDQQAGKLLDQLLGGN